jgi:hypothetical protein
MVVCQGVFQIERSEKWQRKIEMMMLGKGVRMAVRRDM